MHRVLCTGGVVLRRVGLGGWAIGGALAPGEAPPAALPEATLRALGLRPATPPRGIPAQPPAPVGDWTAADPDALAAHDGVRPLVLVTTAGDALADGGAHLVSAAGTLGWRPPLDRLLDHPRLAPHALRLRFLVDTAELRAIAAADRYARAAEAARHAATLLGARELSAIAVRPALFVETEALLATARETLDAVLALAACAARAEAPNGRDARRGAQRPRRFDTRLLAARAIAPELRDALLDVWEAHGVHAAGHRRALRRAAAAELGPPTVRVQRVSGGAWSVRAPIAPESPDGRALARERRPRHDALTLAWTFATETWRLAARTIYQLD